MITNTTNTIEGHPVREYLGIVTGETIIGANIFKDIFAGICNIVGGRSGTEFVKRCKIIITFGCT